jgi:hypothetical protein
MPGHLTVPYLQSVSVQMGDKEQSTEADLSFLLALEVDDSGDDKAKC